MAALPTPDQLDELFITDGQRLFWKNRPGNPPAGTQGDPSLSRVKIGPSKFNVTRVIWVMTHRQDPGSKSIVRKDPNLGWHVDNLELADRDDRRLPWGVQARPDGRFEAYGVRYLDKLGYEKSKQRLQPSPKRSGIFDTVGEALYYVEKNKAYQVRNQAIGWDASLAQYEKEGTYPRIEEFLLMKGELVSKDDEKIRQHLATDDEAVERLEERLARSFAPFMETAAR